MNLEELEAELWRLRSAMYDFELLKSEHEEFQIVINNLQDQLAYTDKLLKEQLNRNRSLDSMIKSADEDLSTAKAETAKYRQERDLLLRKLEALEQASHMNDTYGFKVIEDRKCPGCQVSVGQSHWDNCPLVPPFSQPIFR